MRIINQSEKYRRLPSEIARIKDEYVAFCFDEDCMYISSQLEEKKKPRWSEDLIDQETGKKKTFISEAWKKQRKEGK